MTPPMLIVAIPLEGRPRVVLDVLSEAEAARLAFWLVSAERVLAAGVLDALREARLRLAGDEEGAP